ncbi:MAG: transcription elongation factor GreA [Acidobacteria bacterium]|nr:transcription elongation factor GreA [Acidobacteriota bacterium]
MKHVVKNLEEEVTKLEYELVHELPKELKKALAHGDLRENAEYQAAKERKDFVQVRISQLKKRIADLSLLRLDDMPEDRVSFGSTVTLLDLDRQAEITYKLVTAEESDISKGLISTTSPIGRGLMGRAEGDNVEIVIPSGRKRFEIVRLRTIHQG